MKPPVPGAEKSFYAENCAQNCGNKSNTENRNEGISNLFYLDIMFGSLTSIFSY